VSLLHREPRPLSRDREVRYRDSRLFLIGCDDRYAPVQYFGFLELSRVRIVADPTVDGRCAPQHVLNRLLRRRDEMELEEDDECWLVLDTDHNPEPNHRAQFLQTLRDAREAGVRVALSCPCFEFWLLLHHAAEHEVAGLSSCAEIQDAIRTRVGSYNKTRLRREHYRDGSAAQAVLRAEAVDASVAGGDIPDGPTTRVYRLIRAIVEKSLPSQLPPELRGIAISLGR
jgi:nucleotide-binding universal stress UspA family protein